MAAVIHVPGTATKDFRLLQVIRISVSNRSTCLPAGRTRSWTRRLAGWRATAQFGEADRPRSAFSCSEIAANRWIDRSRLIAPGPNRDRSRGKL